MALEASKPVNNLLFVLIGERLIQANEDLARLSHGPYRRLAQDLRNLSDAIEDSIVTASKGLPSQAGDNYRRAMGLLVNDGGTNYLKQFSKQVDEIADGRVKTSWNITESKWQIIAEVIRLMVELLVILALSVFSGGTSAGRVAVAKARSRVVVLTVMDTLIRQTHLLPILGEAFEEALQAFVVRLALITFSSGEGSFKNFDWGAIGQEALFGALAGGFMGLFAGTGSKIGNAVKKAAGVTPAAKDVAGDIASKAAKASTEASTKASEASAKAGKDAVAPDAGNLVTNSTVGKVSKDANHFIAEGGSESLAEVIGGGLVTGNWSTSWDSFLGAGISGKVGNSLTGGAQSTGLAINEAMFGTVPATVGSQEVPGAGTDAGPGPGTGDADAPGGSGTPGTHANAASGTVDPDDGTGTEPLTLDDTAGSGAPGSAATTGAATAASAATVSTSTAGPAGRTGSGGSTGSGATTGSGGSPGSASSTPSAASTSSSGSSGPSTTRTPPTVPSPSPSRNEAQPPSDEPALPAEDDGQQPSGEGENLSGPAPGESPSAATSAQPPTVSTDTATPTTDPSVSPTSTITTTPAPAAAAAAVQPAGTSAQPPRATPAPSAPVSSTAPTGPNPATSPATATTRPRPVPTTSAEPDATPVLHSRPRLESEGAESDRSYGADDTGSERSYSPDDFDDPDHGEQTEDRTQNRTEPAPTRTPARTAPHVAAFEHAVEIARAEVLPQTLPPSRRPGFMTAYNVRGFEARRYRLPDGGFGTRAVLRLHLDPIVPAGGTPVTDEQLASLGRRAQEGIDTYINRGSRLPDGDLFRVDLELVQDPGAAHHVIEVASEVEREWHSRWGLATGPDVLAHEVGHLLGLADEYREGPRFGRRPVYGDGALMDGPSPVDDWGRADIDAEHSSSTPGGAQVEGRWWIPPRHLRQIGAAVEGALRGAETQGTGDTGGRSGPDGMPTRPEFSLDVRRAALYGDPVSGAGGLLPPSGLSSRRPPVAVEGSENPNGTFRAVYPGAGGTTGPDPVRGPGRTNVVSHPLAGDLVMPEHTGPDDVRDVVMFPPYWTEDDAVYAAEQAYLEALRVGAVVPVAGRAGAFTWVGEYGGVRIEGELERGEFTGFRPSGGQPDTPAPDYLPKPPLTTPPSGPEFGRRVEDVVRFGDRRTRTGAHHAPAEGQGIRHGLMINRETVFDNGTHRAKVWFLDPALDTSDPLSAFPRHWRLHQDRGEHTMFPDDWSSSQVLHTVRRAHAAALDTGTVRPMPDGRTRHWVGEADGVRVEGLVRDGRHVAYRPTAVQPYLRRPEQGPVAGTDAVPGVAARDGQSYGFDVRHVLFDNGQRGLDLTVRIHAAAGPGADTAAVTALQERMRAVFARTYGSAARADGAPLVSLSLDFTQNPETAHRVVDAGPQLPDDQMIEAGLPQLLGVWPMPEDLAALAHAVGAAAPDSSDWWPTGGTDPVGGRTALERAIALADPFGSPTTLREPDPSDTGRSGTPATTYMSEWDDDVRAAFAPGAPHTRHPDGTFPADWTYEDLLYAAHEVVGNAGADRNRPGAQTVPGRFLDTWLSVTLEDGLIVDVHPAVVPEDDAGNTTGGTGERSPQPPRESGEPDFTTDSEPDSDTTTVYAPALFSSDEEDSDEDDGETHFFTRSVPGPDMTPAVDHTTGTGTPAPVFEGNGAQAAGTMPPAAADTGADFDFAMDLELDTGLTGLDVASPPDMPAEAPHGVVDHDGLQIQEDLAFTAGRSPLEGGTEPYPGVLAQSPVPALDNGLPMLSVAARIVAAARPLRPQPRDEELEPERQEAGPEGADGAPSVSLAPQGSVTSMPPEQGATGAAAAGGDPAASAPVVQGAPVASGQVATDRWIPFTDPFEIDVEDNGRPRIRRRPGSGERTQVGYGWELLRDGRAQETVRMTRRVHLVTGHTDPAQVAALRSGLASELERLVNSRGHRLPLGSAPEGSGPRLEVAVEFVDSPQQAHSVIRLRDGLPDGRTMRQDTWYTGVHPAAYVHEIVHGLGVIDDDADPQALLTPGGRGEQVLTDDESSLMGTFTAPHAQRFVLTSDHLRQIADVLAPYVHRGPVTPPGPTTPQASAFDQAAAVNYSMVHEADHAVLVLSGEDEILWRFTNDPPETVFARGFRARNTQVVVTLQNWARALGEGPYLSTTRSPRLWFLQSRYRYQIDASRNDDPTGVDVNATFAQMTVPSPFPNEQEVAFTGGVDPAAVVTVYDSREQRTGTWNPLTQEVEWEPGQLDVEDPDAAGHGGFGAAEQAWLAGDWGGSLFPAQDAWPAQPPTEPEPATGAEQDWFTMGWPGAAPTATPALPDWSAAGWQPSSPPPDDPAEDTVFDPGDLLSFLDTDDGDEADGDVPGSDVAPAVDYRATATTPPAPQPGTDGSTSTGTGTADEASGGPSAPHPEPHGTPSPVAPSVFDGAVEVARGEVVPPGENLRRWGGTGTLVQSGTRRYEARRYTLAGGESATRLRVRVRLEPTGSMDPERLGRVAELARQGVETHYNQGSRLPNGDLFRVDLEFVSDPETQAHVVRLHESLERADFRNWSTALDATVLAHEVGHLLGLLDEYREGRVSGMRPVYLDGALMDGPAGVDSRGRANVDKDHPSRDPVMTGGRGWIPPRHLRQLGSAVDAALGGHPEGARFDGQDTFTGRGTLAPRSDGLPARAAFPLDVRRSVLYGDGDSGEGGLLPPSGLSSRRRPVAVVGSERPNGTFRAVYPGGEGAADQGSVPEVVSHPLAGDLVVGPRPAPGVREAVMFPSYWTEDDAVYAAEQAYLDALRAGAVVPVDGREAVFAWVGEYGGVRIEGTLEHGEFTGFRPSGDQPDTSAPAYLPAPATVPATRPGFGSRVEEVARFGERNTRTGAYHVPGQGHGVNHGRRIDLGTAFDNGTYRATVWFLDPRVAAGDMRSAVLSRWRLHRDGTEHVLFPAIWSPHRVLTAVEDAYAAAVTAGTVRRLPDGRTDHWAGEAGGVRIEGLVRDGQHVAYRPTPVQPHTRWPALHPVGETAPVPAVLTRNGRAHGFDVRHILFPDGHRGLELTARVHLDAPPGDPMADMVWSYLQHMVLRIYGGTNRVHGAPLVRLVRVGRDQAPHHIVPADPDVLDGVGDGTLLGVPPEAAGLVRAGEELAGAQPDPTAWLPPRGTQDGPAARTAIAHALTLPPRSDGPWPQEQPVGEVTSGPGQLTREGRTFGFDVRHVLFADGQRGLDLAVRIHLEPSPDGPDRTGEVRRTLQAEMTRHYSAVTRADGAPLVRMSPVFVDTPETAHHTIRLEPDPATDRDRILTRLPEILGVQPTSADLAVVARDLGGDPPNPDDWTPTTGGDGTEGQTAIRQALVLADPLGTPTTLREPDPAHTGDPGDDVPTLMQDEVDAALARALAPQAPRTDHPRGTFPAGWTRQDLRYAAYVALRSSASPLAPRGTTTVHGTFGTLDLYLTIEDGLVVDIHPSPPVTQTPQATGASADDAGEPGPDDDPHTGTAPETEESVIDLSETEEPGSEEPEHEESKTEEPEPEEPEAEEPEPEEPEAEEPEPEEPEAEEPELQEPVYEEPETEEPVYEEPETSASEPPAPAPTAAAPPTARNRFPSIEVALDTHRPVRIDTAAPPPDPSGDGQVRFSDGSRLPLHLTGYGTGGTAERSYGHSQVSLRGSDLVDREITERLGARYGDLSAVPGLDAALADLRRALETAPQVFHGDGYESPAFGESPGRTTLRVVTRPHGNWERFKDIREQQVKVDAGQRSQHSTGTTGTASTRRRITAGVGLLPGPGQLGVGGVAVTGGITRSYQHGLQDQTLSQVETRMGEGSHLHLDDLRYDVSLVTETPPAREGAPTDPSASDSFGFTARHGLAVRLPDSLTTPTGHGRVPSRMTLDARSGYRLVHTEGYGPLRALRDRLAEEMGVPRGSAAHAYLSAFFSSETFHRMSDRLATGAVATEVLSDDEGTPLGAFVVERVVPGEAELIQETRTAEMRSTVQHTTVNEQNRSRTSSAGASLNGGLLLGLGPLGLATFGLSTGRERSNTEGSAFGGSGARKIVGRAKNVPTVLYRVRKTVEVRMTGTDQVIRFDTWSLDRMTHTEARRLAGWDDGTTLRARGGNEPHPPVYLTENRPVVLGMSRLETIAYDAGDPAHEAGDPAHDDGVTAGEEGADATGDHDGATTSHDGGTPTHDTATGGDIRPRDWLGAFTDRVIQAAAARYPGVLAPLTDFGDPSDSRWRNPLHYATALQNTLRVTNALSHHGFAAALETLTTTGLPIRLDVPPGTFRRTHLTLRIGGVLTGRRYLGTQNDLLLRITAPGTERLDGSQGITYSDSTGFGMTLRGDHINGTVGPVFGRSRARETQYGATATHEPLAAGSGPSHLFGYRLELTAVVEGFRRYRTGPRILSFGLLGAGPQESTDLIGGTAGEPFTGRAVLSVPGEHSPVVPPPPSAVDGESVPQPLTREQAQALLTGDPTTAPPFPDPDPDVFGDQPHQTVAVGTPLALAHAAQTLLAQLSGASWHFARSGAVPHDATVRFFEAHSVTAGFDQLSGPTGSRISLFAEGVLRHRVGEVVHRVQVTGLHAVSGPVAVATELAIGGDLRTGGSLATARSLTLTGALNGGGTTHPHRTELTTFSGLQLRRGSSSAAVMSVTRTVTSDINVDDGSLKVLVSGDTRHDIAVSVRLRGPLHLALAPFYREGPVGTRLTVPSGYLGHIPEKAAHRLGLLDDGLGEVPRYAAQEWVQGGWWRDHPFGSYPVNSLDATAVLTDFDRRLREWGVDDTGRERARSLVTPRALRALREQMASTGASASVRAGRFVAGLRIGSRSALMRVELIAVDVRFDGIGHGAVMEDTRTATVTETDSTSQSTLWALGVSAVHGVSTLPPHTIPGHGDLTTVRVPYEGTVTGSRDTSRALSHTRTRRQTFYAREPHAEYLTRYRLRLTLETGDGILLRSEDDAGTLREQVPLSLTDPGQGTAPPYDLAHDLARGTTPAHDPLGPPVAGRPVPSVTLWRRPVVSRADIDAWRTLPLPDGTRGPFRAPSNGFHVRRVVGLGALRDAAVLALAQAHGTVVVPTVAVPTGNGPHELTGTGLEQAVARARRTGLTRPGSGAALALDSALADAALAAFFQESGSRDGYQVPGLHDGSRAHGTHRLYSRPDFTRATLLTVIPDTVMESGDRTAATGSATASHSGGFDSAFGAQPVLDAGLFGSAAPPVSLTGPNAGSGGRGADSATDGAQLTNKPAARGFVFAVPTDWLGVAEVETPNGPFGSIVRTRAVETRSELIVVVQEDTARELGLVDDAGFPPQVAGAWSEVTAAAKAWTAADDAYWARRRELGTLSEETPELTRGDLVTTLKRQILRPLLARAGAAAAEYHRVRAAADRLTRWHRLPAEDHAAGEQETRQGLAEPPPVHHEPLPDTGPGGFGPGGPAPSRYTRPDDAPGHLMSPGDDLYTVHDVPHDGDAFFHALAEGLHHTDPGALASRVPLTDRRTLVAGLRQSLADGLAEPENADLLEFLSPDSTDTFTDAELRRALVDFGEGTPEQREFEGSGHLPLHARLTGGQRTALGQVQLGRSGATSGDGGWNHGTADLLPALAARVFGVRITVVGEDGTFQEFGPAPHGTTEHTDDGELAHLVMELKERHYRPALPSGDARRRPPLPAPQTTEEEETKEETKDAADTEDTEDTTDVPDAPSLPAYDAPPWAPHAGTWSPVVSEGRLTSLTGPDGAAHRLVEPPAPGFWHAVAALPGLTETDRERLAALPVRTVPRTGDGPGERAAALEAAAALRARVTVVAEDGTAETAAPGEGPGTREVILYRRGRDYLVAGPSAGEATQPDDPEREFEELLASAELLDTPVRQDQVAGLGFSSGAAATWMLEDIALPLGDLRLGREDLVTLLSGHPGLFPEAVRTEFLRLTAARTKPA